MSRAICRARCHWVIERLTDLQQAVLQLFAAEPFYTLERDHERNTIRGRYSHSASAIRLKTKINGGMGTAALQRALLRSMLP
jgi:hypothetical protein